MLPLAFNFLIQLPIILLSISMHEFGHAAMAEKLGDPTPRLQGRLTLNPLAHLDMLGTAFIIFAMFGGYVIGWGKPVQVNPTYFRNYREGLILVASAGPLMNVSLAMFGLGLAYLLFQTGVEPPPILPRILDAWIGINVVLAVFNLIPIPPLDGGNILASLLPTRSGERLRQFGPYGMLIILALMYLRVLGFVIGLAQDLNFMLIRNLLGLGFAHWLEPWRFMG